MRFEISIYTDGDAFKPDPLPEVRRILTELVLTIQPSDLKRYFPPVPLVDANGNHCGCTLIDPGPTD